MHSFLDKKNIECKNAFLQHSSNHSQIALYSILLLVGNTYCSVIQPENVPT